MANRSRKDEMKYRKLLEQKPANSDCPFCTILPDSQQFVDNGEFFTIIRPIAKYTYWDEQKVADHLMITPKDHIESISKLPVGAAEEFLELLGRYESHGYSVYARAPGTKTKTVIHQHSHLIKVTGKRKKFSLHIKKPYILIMK